MAWSVLFLLFQWDKSKTNVKYVRVQWTEGAEVLGGINFDSAELSDHKKADIYVRCAEAYIEVSS